MRFREREGDRKEERVLKKSNHLLWYIKRRKPYGGSLIELRPSGPYQWGQCWSVSVKEISGIEMVSCDKKGGLVRMAKGRKKPYVSGRKVVYADVQRLLERPSLPT